MQKIKTDERTSHIPVILLTAKSSQNDQIEGLQHGADLYLTKPFSSKILNLSVKNLLAARETIRQKISRELAYLNLPAKKQPDSVALENEVDRAFLEIYHIYLLKQPDNENIHSELPERARKKQQQGMV